MKRPYNQLLSCFFAVWLPAYLVAQSSEPLPIKTDFRSIDLLPEVSYRIGNSWQAYGQDAAQWEKATTTVLKVPGDSTIWLHFFIYNQDSIDRSLELYLHNVMLSRSKLWVVQNQQLHLLDSTGCLVPVSQRSTRQRDMSLFFPIKAGQTLEVYISTFRRAFPNNVVLGLADVRYGDGPAWEDLFAVFVLGFCALIWLASLVIWLTFRAKEYVYYWMYATGGTLYLAAADGYGSIYLWPEQSWFQECAPVFFVSLGLAGFVLFSNQVLRVKAIRPKLSLLLRLSIPCALIFMGASLIFAKGRLPSAIYVKMAIFSGSYTVVALISVLVLALWRAIKNREAEYWWFAAIFGNLFVLSTGALLLETSWITFRPQITVVFMLILVPLEMTLTMAYLVWRLYAMLRERQRGEIRALEAKQKIFDEKEEQQRYYTSLLHEIIKGEAQSILAEVREPGPVKEQLTELVKACELGYSFINPNNNNLYDFMAGMKFIYSSRLHSETEERYFYCDLDASLKEIQLNHQQKYELIFWLRECLNNIRKYAHYQYASLKVSLESSGEAVVLVVDDGIGLPAALELPEDDITISAGNFPGFYQRYLSTRRSTGIKELFEKAGRLPGQLTIRSTRSKGTVLELRFFPNSG